MTISRSIAFLIAAIYIVGYAPALAVACNLALKTNSFSRQRTLKLIPFIGFTLAAISRFVTYWYWLGSGLSIVHPLYAGVLTALKVFAITYFWLANATHFWRSTLLAGLLTMTTGPLGLVVIRAAVGLLTWREDPLLGLVDIPFFVLGALTHLILRAGNGIEGNRYYHLSVSRVVLVIAIAPIVALLAWCSGVLVAGPQLGP